MSNCNEMLNGYDDDKRVYLSEEQHMEYEGCLEEGPMISAADAGMAGVFVAFLIGGLILLGK